MEISGPHQKVLDVGPVQNYLSHEPNTLMDILDQMRANNMERTEKN